MKSPNVSLARIVSDEGRAEGNPECAGRCRKRKIEAAPYLRECSAGGISGVVFRHRYACAGNCAGRRKRGRKDRKGIEKSGVIRYSKNVVFHK